MFPRRYGHFLEGVKKSKMKTESGKTKCIENLPALSLGLKNHNNTHCFWESKQLHKHCSLSATDIFVEGVKTSKIRTKSGKKKCIKRFPLLFLHFFSFCFSCLVLTRLISSRGVSSHLISGCGDVWRGCVVGVAGMCGGMCD